MSTSAATKPSGIPWLGEVPAHWEAKRLKYLASTNDEALSETANPTQEIVYVEIGGVDAVEGIVAKEQLVLEDAPSRARRLVRHGDTIVSTVRTYLRAIAPIRDPEPNLIVSTGFAVIRPRELEPDYLGYALRSPYFIETIVSRSTGVSYPGINASEIGNIEVAYPPPPEQRAIAAFLDERTARIDGLIARKQRLVQLLKEKRQALITRAVTRGLDANVNLKESGVPWLGEVPEHWEVKPLGYLVTMRGGCTPSRSDPGFWDGEIPWASPKDIKIDHLTDTEEHVTDEALTGSGLELIRDRSLLLVVRGMILAKRVPTSIMEVPMTINQDMKALLPIEGAVLIDYLKLIFDGLQGPFSSVIEEAGHGTKALRTDLIRALKLPIPHIDEQRDIVSRVQSGTARIDALVTKVEQAVLRLQEYRTALISAAVTGKVRVPNGRSADQKIRQRS